MKAHQRRLAHNRLQTALPSALSIDARHLAVLAALILAMVQARTVVLYALKSHVDLPCTLDTRYQRLRRFIQFQLPDGLFIRFALAILPDGDLELILDRTNWKLGQQDVNPLMLFAVWSGFSLPLIWTVLSHGVSSSQVLREELLTRFLSVCPDRKITGLLADREFVGETWFAFLDQHSIPPCIRLLAPATVGTGGPPIWACFKKLQPGDVRRWHRPIRVYGVLLRGCGEILYLAYRGRASINLERYSRL